MPNVSTIDTEKIIRESFLIAPFLSTAWSFFLVATLTPKPNVDSDLNQSTAISAIIMGVLTLVLHLTLPYH
jgi:hypothetical protein